METKLTVKPKRCPKDRTILKCWIESCKGCKRHQETAVEA
jgi:hypothetical protein